MTGMCRWNSRAVLRRLRGEPRRIGRRDYFPPPERDAACAAAPSSRTVTGHAQAVVAGAGHLPPPTGATR
jgi:hypothetical protein